MKLIKTDDYCGRLHVSFTDTWIFSSSEMKYLTHTLFMLVKTAFSIYDFTGRKVLEGGEITVADISILKSGIFILEAAKGHTVKIEINE